MELPGIEPIAENGMSWANAEFDDAAEFDLPVEGKLVGYRSVVAGAEKRKTLSAVPTDPRHRAGAGRPAGTAYSRRCLPQRVTAGIDSAS
ncbi:hypothetical protein A5625_09890 [Mycobacterium sp. 1465703.0]|nr:hypothetical protein A5625_09890 [Mycobacterium sp. 1465703.0]